MVQTSSRLTEQFPALQFKRPWLLLLQPPGASALSSIESETTLLNQVGSGAQGPTLLVSHHPRCLVATRREARMSGFAQARKVLEQEGWPLVVRSSGGSCVPQGPGMLNLSLAFPRIRDWTLDDGYQLICSLLKGLFRDFGLEATTGEVPGSFCDGRYNLQVDGKKLVGTAQRWAGGTRDKAAILIHACLLVDIDLTEATFRINQLYRLCDNPQQFAPEACTTLRTLLDPSLRKSPESFSAEIEQRLIRLLHKTFNLTANNQPR